MKNRTKELDVDFIGGQRPLTENEKSEINKYFIMQKQLKIKQESRRKGTVQKTATDLIDKFIFEKKLRISYLVIDKRLNLIASILNNGKILSLRLSDYPRLKKASPAQLNKWKLISNGIGVEWEALDEDLSIKGMIKTTAINGILRNLSGDKESVLI